MNNKGQALLVVIFAMTLGLLVLVGVAGRVITGVSRTSQSNFYQKAQAAAEGAAETFVTRTNDELEILKGICVPSDLFETDTLPNPDAVNPLCAVTYGEARAVVGVEDLSSQSGTLELTSAPGGTLHINLAGIDTGTSINVKWKGQDAGGLPAYSESYYFMYGGTRDSYTVTKDLYKCNGGTGTTWCKNPPSGYTTNAPTTATAEGDFSTYTVVVPDDPIALRIFTFPGGGAYRITAGSGSFSSQGYRIIAVGETTVGTSGTSLESKKAARKKVIVEKTFSYPSGVWFDMAATSLAGKISPFD